MKLYTIKPANCVLLSAWCSYCSIALMAECVRVFQQSTKCTLVEALEGATLHPAQLLGNQLT